MEMTRQEHKTLTKQKIREAKTGKEVTEAFIQHFKKFGPQKKPPMTVEMATEAFNNTPLYDSTS